MDAVKTETLPSSNSIVNASAPESPDISKKKDEAIFSVDDNSEDDEIQLRLSDDEDTEPDNASDHSKCPQTNIRPQNKDLELLDSATPAKKSKLFRAKKSPEQNLREEELDLVIKEESLENIILHEKSSDELGDIDDQDLKMSGSEKVPPYMQSSPKYWNNHFDKRWNGSSSPRDRQSFPHRRSDWYRQQYPDKNQFNHKNNLSNHNDQYCRLRSSSRGSYDQSRDKWKRDPERESKNKFQRSRRSLERTGVTNSKVNGDCDDQSLVKHDTHNGKKESPVPVISQNGEKIEKEKEDCDQKIEKVMLAETKESSFQKSDDHSVKTSDKLGKNDSKPIDNSENSVDVQESSDNVLTQPKDCDEPLTENKKEECSSKVENVESTKDDDSQNIIAETHGDGKPNSPSSVEKQVCSNSELPDGTNLEVSDATSQNENKESEKNENVMEVDENNTNSCDSGFTNSTSNGKSSSSDNSKDSDLEVSDNNDRNAGDEEVNDEQVTEEKESRLDDLDDSQTTKAIDDAPSSEDTSQSPDERSMVIDEIEKSLESDGVSSDLKADVPDSELSQVTQQESSNSCLLVISETKDTNSEDLKVSNDSDSAVDDSENSSKVDENDCNQAACVEDESENNIEESEPKSSEDRICDDDDSMKMAESDEHESLDNIVEEVDLLEDEMEVSEETPSVEPPLKPTDDINSDESNHLKADDDKGEKMNVDAETVVHKKHRRRKLLGIDCRDITNEDGVRQKRLSAKNAEDLIRKGVTTDGEDEESSAEDSEPENVVQADHHKANIEESRSSPSVQKRALEDVDPSTENENLKRIRMSSEKPSLVPMTPQPTLVPMTPQPTLVPMTPQPTLVPMTPQPTLVPMTSQPYEKRDHIPISKESAAKTNDLVRKVSTEIGKLKKMTLEEIEALVLQKITESLTFRGENGKLREEVKSLKRSLEASRTKCQQLQKQVEGFDMVLKRITYDKNSNADKYLPPIKINRSVGLQVNFLSSEHGVQNLKQIQMRTAASGSSPAKTASPLQDSGNRPPAPSPRKQVKTRSPRRPEITGPAPASTSPVASIHPVANGQVVAPSSQMTGLTPLNKQTPEILRRPLTLPNNSGSVIKDLLQQQPQQTLQQLPQQTMQQSLLQAQHQPMQIQQPTQVQQQQIAQAQQIQLHQPIVVASSLNNQPNRTSGIMNKSITSTPNNTSDLIDLTDEEDRAKPSVVIPMTSTTGYQRVLQAVPTSVPLSTATNLRIVQTSVQSPPNAVVNSAGRILYTVPSSVNGQPRQIVLANSNAMRPVTSLTTKNISNLAYKQVVPTLQNGIQNGTVRVLTTGGSQSMIQHARQHPAPLPETPVMESNPKWKLTPPAPSLKISKVANGIVLSWNMVLSDKFAEIVSYQLYAYQEIAGTAPNAAQWKKVGDVRALPLPMACTLTQFTEGNNYYFAVRAVDVHSRLGQYSKPGNISL